MRFCLMMLLTALLSFQALAAIALRRELPEELHPRCGGD